MHMQKFWGWLAVELGKRAGLITAIGLVVTAILGFGITKLEFATGQDSYLDSGSQIAKDNVDYQKLFGGQAMVTLVTIDKGVDQMDLLVGDNAKLFTDVANEIRKVPGVMAVVNPIDVVRYSSNIAIGPGDASKRTVVDAAGSLGGKATLDALERTTTMAAKVTDPTEKAEWAKSVELRQKDLAANQTRLGKIPQGKYNISNPEWVRFVLNGNDGNIRPAVASFFPDNSHIQMVTRLEGNLSIKDEGAAALKVAEIAKKLHFEGAKVVTTGAPILIDEINQYLTSGMVTLGAIAFGLMIIILLIFFDVRWRLLPLVVVAIGVVWAFGLAGYVGIPLNLVTIAGLPVMLGVGIDYAIQMHSRIEEEVIIDRDEHPIQETARNLGPALLVVTFDAVFAFSALLWAKTPMIRDFGILLAVGVAVICLCSIINPLAWLGLREYRSPTKGRDFREGALGRLVVWLGSASPKMAKYFAVASLIVFFGGIAVESKLIIQTDPEKWVNQSSAVLKDLHTLSDETGSSSELGIFVRTKAKFEGDKATIDQPTVDAIHNFTRQVNAKYGPGTKYDGIIAGGNSFLSVMADTIVVPGTKDLPPLAKFVEESYTLAMKQGEDTSSIPKILIAGDALNIIFRTGPSGLAERSVVVNEIRDAVYETGAKAKKVAGISPLPDDVRATPSGLAVVGVGLLENLESGRIMLTYLAIAFVAIFLAVRMRSVVRSLLSLVPVLIATGAASLVAWIFGFQLSPMTAVGGPLVVAVCTEFTSLILLRFVEERNRGLDPQEAADVTASRTGRAFIVSGMTATIGVLTIAASSMPLLRDFGLIVALNVVVALISALVILPPMLVWADHDDRKWVSRGMGQKKPTKSIETDYHPSPNPVIPG